MLSIAEGVKKRRALYAPIKAGSEVYLTLNKTSTEFKIS